MEENALKEIIPKAWAVAESKIKKKHHQQPANMISIPEEKVPSAKKPLIKSQNTIMEE